MRRGVSSTSSKWSPGRVIVSVESECGFSYGKGTRVIRHGDR